ncbi:hypothetical protein [Metabacillus fastidiosus]|uniref:Uncharacterized protein n=1 Tax=Metabacillus fastidiosus TaxID=1458 RepID=A0ABU6NW28_9BACI|nr:hypothetical protein [Metabacillus fastidiosus]MED4401331.1 hypothetical protein [Metabacillus fastidiosus]MED4461717.1 hypothetical protein [Metabacillus fastidiosus]
MFELDREKVYIAHFFKSVEEIGYSNVERIEYFIVPRKTHCYVYFGYELKQHRGYFPLEWFTDFSEVDSLPACEQGEIEQLSLFEEGLSNAG